MQAVILAGGEGTRLKPFTQVLPKSMFPIYNMPLLEIIVRYLHSYEIDDITIATSHLSRYIKHYFGDGKQFGINISYTTEDVPLGTAGPLKLISNKSNGPIIVKVSDVLADIDYRELISSHKKSGAIGTMVICDKSIEIPMVYLR